MDVLVKGMDPGPLQGHSRGTVKHLHIGTETAKEVEGSSKAVKSYLRGEERRKGVGGREEEGGRGGEEERRRKGVGGEGGGRGWEEEREKEEGVGGREWEDRRRRKGVGGEGGGRGGREGVGG